MVASADQGVGSSRLVSPKITTSGGGELILAFVEADGPTSATQRVTGVSGGGLVWRLASRANESWGTAEVWQAYATSTLTGVNVTANLAKTGYDGSITVAAFKGAATQVGATARAWGVKGAPSVTVTPTRCNSLVWAAGHDWSNATRPVPAAGQSLVHVFLDRRVNDSFWTQSVDAPTSAGTPVKLSDSKPVSDRWSLAAVEIPGA